MSEVPGKGIGLTGDELGLSLEGIGAKRVLAEYSRTVDSGRPTCLADEFGTDVTGQTPDHLEANTAEIVTVSTENGGLSMSRRCGKIGCQAECRLSVGPDRIIIDATLIKSKLGLAACAAGNEE